MPLFETPVRDSNAVKISRMPKSLNAKIQSGANCIPNPQPSHHNTPNSIAAYNFDVSKISPFKENKSHRLLLFDTEERKKRYHAFSVDRKEINKGRNQGIQNFQHFKKSFEAAKKGLMSKILIDCKIFHF